MFKDVGESCSERVDITPFRDCDWPVSGEPRLARRAMKKLIFALVALGLAVSFAAPTFAASPKNKADRAACEKAGKQWDYTTKTCSERY